MKTILSLILASLFSQVVAQASGFFNVGTFMGNGTPGNIIGPNRNILFKSPFGVANYPGSTVFYLADQGNNQIKKIDYVNYTVDVLAGDTIAGYLDSTANEARFNGPSNLCVDSVGTVFVSDFNNHRIRKIATNGVVTTLAGSGIPGFQDGIADSARFNYPRGIAVDDSGNVYVADSWNHRIRKISPSGIVSTLAGGGTTMGVNSIGDWVDGSDTIARFYTPAGLIYTRNDNCLYLADAYNHRIRKITLTGFVSTLIGTGSSGPGNGGYAIGNSSTARLNTPTELTYYYMETNLSHFLIISDTYNHMIREFNFGNNSLGDIAGSLNSGFIDNWGDQARFDFPRGIVSFKIGGTGRLIVCDYNNHSLRGILDFFLSTDQDTQFNSIKIWPQPASSTLHFSEEIQSLKIYDATGKLILSQSYPTGIQALPIQDWSPGLYRITGAASSGHSLNQSFLIQK